MGNPKSTMLQQGLVDKPTNQHDWSKQRCGRLRAEFSIGLFTEYDTNGKLLSLGRSFYTNKNPFIGVLKVFLFVLTVTTYFYGVALSPEPKFFFAYLTNWSLTYALIYQTLSMLNTWLFDSLLVIKISWVMFSVAAVHQIGVTILFWFAEYDRSVYEINYFTVMAHGGVCLAVLVEGLIINKVPVRLKHYMFVVALAILYLIWTLIQNLVLQYNPYSDDDDIALYDALAWKKDATSAGIFATLLILLFLPAIQLWLWWASLMGRRYREEDDDEADQQKQQHQKYNPVYSKSMEIPQYHSPIQKKKQQLQSVAPNASRVQAKRIQRPVPAKKPSTTRAQTPQRKQRIMAEV